MDFELAEDHRMLKDLVGRFVDDELMPLEGAVLDLRSASSRMVLLNQARSSGCSHFAWSGESVSTHSANTPPP